MTARRDVLTLTGWLTLALTPLFAAGLLLDPRLVDGAPAWLKPLKFVVSISLYSFTLAWILTYLPDWPRLRRRAGAITAAAFVIEVVLIAGQAARGRTSHFNTSTPLDVAIFAVMGLAIFTQTIAAGAVALALWRQPFTAAAMGWALRLGMVVAVGGASIGGMMTQPTAVQLTEVRATHQMPRSGAHTVGAPDGGPGLPGTGWSSEHGDLRVPHFVGLHAIQVLPLLAWLVGRRLRERAATRAVLAAAASYAALTTILLVQALLGQPVLAPQGPVRMALLLWAVATVAAGLLVWRTPANPAPRASATQPA